MIQAEETSDLRSSAAVRAEGDAVRVERSAVGLVRGGNVDLAQAGSASSWPVNDVLVGQGGGRGFLAGGDLRISQGGGAVFLAGATHRSARAASEPCSPLAG